jgi:hypothetical protein
VTEPRPVPPTGRRGGPPRLGLRPSLPAGPADRRAGLRAAQPAAGRLRRPDGTRGKLWAVKDLDARRYRAWVNEANENPPLPAELRQLQLRERTATAHPTTCYLERAFDRLKLCELLKRYELGVKRPPGRSRKWRSTLNSSSTSD